MVFNSSFTTTLTLFSSVISLSELNELALRIENNFKKFDKIANLDKQAKKKSNFMKVVNISDFINKEKKRNLITIETVDSQGLLANIAKVFLKNKVSIFSARINTLGERVEDTFEIENYNKKMVPKYKIKKIVSDLSKIV